MHRRTKDWRWGVSHPHLLSLPLNSIVPSRQTPPPPQPQTSCFAIRPESPRATTYETSDTGQQVNLLAPNPCDPNIYLAILYIFHPWWFFFLMLSSHLPSVCPFLFPPFSFESYNGTLRVDRRIYVGLFLSRGRKEQKDWRQEIGKGSGQNGPVSN